MKKIPLPSKSENIIQVSPFDRNKKIKVGSQVATRDLLNSIVISPKFDKLLHFEYPEFINKSPGNEKLSKFMINNKEIRQHDFFNGVPKFSEDGERFSYNYHFFPKTEDDGSVEISSKQDFIQIDDRSYGPYENVNSPAIFSPNNQRFAFIAEKIDKNSSNLEVRKYLVSVINNGVQKVGDDIKMFVVIDGVEQEYYDFITKRPIFSADSNRIAYPAEKGEINPKQVYVIDKKESAEYDELLEFKFSPDSHHYAFVGRRGRSFFVVHDDVESEAYFFCGGLIFNPITQDLSFTIRCDNKHSVIFYQGKIIDKEFYLIGKQGLMFSKDGKQMAYVANNLINQWKLIVGNKEYGWFEAIGANKTVFSPDGKRLAFFIVKDGKQYMSIDGKFEGPYDGFISSLVFSPDSTRYAYAGKIGDVVETVVDGKKNRSYFGSFNDIFFSKDSKHVVFIVKKKVGSKYFNCVVVDDMEGPIFTRIINNKKNTIKFTQNDSILYYAIKKQGENLNIDLIETSYNIPERYCDKCGDKILNPNNKFCSKCGNKL